MQDRKDKTKNIKPEDISIRHEIKPGDIGYLTYMHGWIYWQDCRYGLAFEGYVCKTFYEFCLGYNPEADRLWMAEYQGKIIGSIAILGRGNKAQLRWFLLHPDYRGIGVGSRLLTISLDYCREKGFDLVCLSSAADCVKAIGMYQKAGFVKIGERENHDWAANVMELDFELPL